MGMGEVLAAGKGMPIISHTGLWRVRLALRSGLHSGHQSGIDETADPTGEGIVAADCGDGSAFIVGWGELHGHVDGFPGGRLGCLFRVGLRFWHGEHNLLFLLIKPI